MSPTRKPEKFKFKIMPQPPVEVQPERFKFKFASFNPVKVSPHTALLAVDQADYVLARAVVSGDSDAIRRARDARIKAKEKYNELLPEE